jgi:Fe-S cluster assembly iron-binding protein IscA
MLTLTPAAAAALSVARAQAGAPDSYGVRFSASMEAPSESASLSLSFVESPGPDDAVSEEDGLKAYVAPEVHGLIGDAVVDVETNGQQSNLVIVPQSASDGTAT